jgi:superfamily I DNA/RNA helicase
VRTRTLTCVSATTKSWQVASLVHYVRLLADPNDEKSLVEVINEPSRRIGQKSVDKLLAQAAARNLNPQGILIEMLKGDLTQVEESFTSGQISRMAGFADIMRRILKSAVGENVRVHSTLNRILLSSKSRYYCSLLLSCTITQRRNSMEMLAKHATKTFPS